VFAAEPLDLVQIAVRRGAADAFDAALAKMGLGAPRPGEVRSAGGLDLLWLQPETYMLILPRGTPRMLEALRPHAALVEQSDGRSAFILSGPQARDVLAKGSRLDFHPRVFGPGRVTAGSFAHVTAVIQQLDATPRFRIIVFSSFAQHIAEWLGHATASACTSTRHSGSIHA